MTLYPTHAGIIKSGEVPVIVEGEAVANVYPSAGIIKYLGELCFGIIRANLGPKGEIVTAEQYPL